MRIVLNQLTAFGLKAGIGHYTDQLLHGLRAQAGDDRIDAFPTGWVRRACEAYARTIPAFDKGRSNVPENEKKVGLLGRIRGGLRQCLYRGGRSAVGLHFRRLCARESYDLYHEPNFIPLPSDCPTAATLHDLSLLLHPQWHPAERVAYFERHLPRTLAQGTHFLTVSDFVREEALRILGIPPEKITRVHNGVRSGLCPLPSSEVKDSLHRLGLPSQFLLYVGTIEPRKNILMLMRAYGSLPAHLRERWPLLLVGRWGWNAGPTAEHLENVARHQGVIHVGYLSDADLATVYNGARALLYPSHYEGFGLPPLEMMACGGAVLASTAGALVETVGGQAHLVPPDDLDGWREAMLRVLTDDAWRQSLQRGAVEKARSYSWDRCAAETLRLYRSLCGKKKREETPQRQAG